MIFSYNWLKEFADLKLSPFDLSDKLTMSGVEVEGITPASERLENVFPANLLSVAPHPDADRLSVCEVETIEGRFSLVCGATNMKPGDIVVLSRPGAILKGGFKIKKSKIRGVVSEGMICSEAELGITDESDGIMILPKTPLDADINALLGLDDYKIDIGITPNRPDLYSILGMSREIGAVMGASFTEEPVSLDESGSPVEAFIAVSNEAPDICRRYMARVIEGVRVAPSPAWLQKRIEAHGIRAINNIVDATNYVLLERGQPLHAFDLSKLDGPHIKVRTASEGESITSLDGKERALEAGMLLITDSSMPQAIAGIMGGKDSEVGEATTAIVLESACFEAASVRKTSRALGLSSESSFIFERGLDVEGVERALDRAASLIVSLSGGTIAKGAIDSYKEKKEKRLVSFRPGRAAAVLGTPVSAAEATDIFSRLAMRVTDDGSTGGVVSVEPPSYRDDIEREVDLIEEVVRLRGFDSVPATLPRATLSLGARSGMHLLKNKLKQTLVSCGFYEAINYSFVSRESFDSFAHYGAGAVTISNPLSEEQQIMRSSLIPSLLENLKRNISRKNDDIALFELSPVFSVSSGVKESWKLSALMHGLREEPSWAGANEVLDFYDIKGIIEKLLLGIGISGDIIKFNPTNSPVFHPGRSAAVSLRDKEVGHLGELHPEIAAAFDIKGAPLAFEIDIKPLLTYFRKGSDFKRLSRYPASTRDIAFLVDEKLAYADILGSIRKIDRRVIEKVQLFDVYYQEDFPPGVRSLALRVTYRSSERTLKSSEIDRLHAKVLLMLKKDFNVEIRD